jgi:hypothetical protein
MMVLLILVGCAKDQDYFDVLSAQQAAWNEVADVLETVKDEPSMAAAKKVLELREEKFEATARKAQALPQPPARVAEQAKHKFYVLQRAMERAQKEVGRIQALPGGKAFCKQFGPKYSGLMSAVQP